jgi:hypothetical protein
LDSDKFVVSTGIGSAGEAAGAVADFASDFISDFGSDLASALSTDFEFSSNELRVGPALPARFGARLALDLAAMFVSRFVFASTWAPNLEPDSAVVPDAADSSWEGSAALDMDEASVALKLVGGDDAGSVVAGGAAGIATGMGIASTYIGAPRDRLHSTRQWRVADLVLGRQAAMAGISETYME